MSLIHQADTFRDVAVLGELLGWDLGFRQLDSGDAAIPAEAVVGSDIVVTRMRLGRRYHQLGTPPPGLVSFGVPISPMSDWFGQTYQAGSILPFNQSGGIDGTSERGFEAMTFSVSRSLLERVSQAYAVDVPDMLYQPRPDSVLGNSASNQRLRRRLQRLVAAPQHHGDPDLIDALALDLLSTAQDASAGADRSPAPMRERALKLALDHLAGHPGENVSVQSICATNGIAVRTLNRAFRERFGVGPKSYIKHQRLSGVRKALLAAPPKVLVADVANDWSFWHLGQFARDYRRLFGELPSDTLRPPN